MIFRFILLLCGVFACSTSVIFIKASGVGPISLAAWRLLVTVVVLAPWCIREYIVHKEVLRSGDYWKPVLPGVALAFHFISWIIAARMTPAANSTLIVNLVPLVMPFLLFFFLRERLTRVEIVATVVALIGVAVMGIQDFNINPRYLQGDLLCFSSMMLFALYLAFGRLNRGGPGFWLYMVPLYFVASVTCFIFAFIFEQPLQLYPWKDILMIIGLALVPTVLGHTILNYSMKHFRGQTVSIVNLFQFISAGTMGFFFFGEFPSPTFYFVSIILTASGILATLAAQKAEKRVETASPGE